MNLLIDIGNTNLRWVWDGDGQPWEVDIVRHSGGIPLDLLARWEEIPAPQRILVSNVGGDAVAAALERVTRALWGVDPVYVSTRVELDGVRIAYAEPSRLGVDRWLALLAADQSRSGSCLIVDAGTAVTFDLLLAGGRHLGGLILPGIDMMRTSLLVGTRIPRVSSEPTEALWATDTAEAIAAGSIQAVAALAARLYDRLSEESSAPVELLLTGGDAPRVAPALARPYEAAPDLVLQGLLRLSRHEAG